MIQIALIALTMLGAPSVWAQGCPANKVAIGWQYVGDTFTTPPPFIGVAGGGSSFNEFAQSSRAATINQLRASNPDCPDATITVWGPGCPGNQTQCLSAVFVGGQRLDGTHCVSLNYQGGLAAHGYEVYVKYKVEGTECYPSTGHTGSTNIETDKTVGDCDSCKVGDPITVATGNVFLKQVDYPAAALGGLMFERYYNSTKKQLNVGRFGRGWNDVFDRKIVMSFNTQAQDVYTGPTMAFAYRPDGRVFAFTVNGSVVTPTDPDTRVTLIKSGSSDWTLIGDDNTQEFYTTVVGSGGPNEAKYTARLTTLRSPAGELLRLYYTGNNFLNVVLDSYGHELEFVPDASGRRVQSMTDSAGNQFQYAYDTAGNLTSVSYPSTTPGSGTGILQRQYQYTPSGSSHHVLTALIDENGQQHATWTYDANGRGKSNYLGANQNLFSLDFTGSNGTATTVTDGAGVIKSYAFSIVNGVPKYDTITTNSSSYAAATYDAGGRPLTKTDKNGNVSNHSYNARGLESSRTEAVGAANVRTITTTWWSSLPLPQTITTYAAATATGTPVQKIDYTYNFYGKVLTKKVTNPSTGVSRTWTYTYDSFNKMLTATEPRTDLTVRTTFTYWACTTGTQCGQVKTIKNSLNHLTQFTTYNASGMPLTIIDPNGVTTTLTYDSRNRVTSQTTAGETTTITYSPIGEVGTVTLADGSSLTLSYDSAHRITQIADGLGNKRTIGYSPMSVPTTESAYDPTLALRRTLTRTIDVFGRIQAQYGAAGTSAVKTEFTYDNNGNLAEIDAPLARQTQQTYDALNRLASVTDPDSGVTTLGYDALDQLTSVTDARGLTTSYVKNGFGDLVSQSSPDTGATTFTYDTGGNLKTKTDARSAGYTATYDAVNRPLTETFTGAAPTLSLSYAYDAGTYGKGHLTGASDANHSIAWTYDALDRVTAKAQWVFGVPRVVDYGYTNGQLTQVTTPSGQVIGYSYSNGTISGITVNGSTLLSNAAHEPFGPVKGWTWGNGTTASRAHDLDGNVTQVGGPETLTLEYDDAFRITQSSNSVSPLLTWTYGYDDRDQLTSAVGFQTYGWSYDAVGNRTGQTGTAATTFVPASTSNRLASTSGALARSYSYDAAGNTTSNSEVTFTFDNRGRMATATKAGVTTTYLYDVFGQRIRKSSSAGETHFVYDEQGHLLGEYDANGALIQEIVWLDDLPVATLRLEAGALKVYFIHTDHLGTPRLITRSSDNVRVWRWDSDPFGVTAPNQNPQGLGTFAFNLRFPGQYFDTESGLHYNYFRDYDPKTGRYVESDPIGMEGGVGQYTYASNDPAQLIDPTGEMPQWIVGAAIGAAGDIAIQLLSNGGRVECIKWDVVGIAAVAGAINPFSSGSALGRVMKGQKMAARAGNRTLANPGSRVAKRAQQRADKHHRKGGQELGWWGYFEGSAEMLGNFIPDEKHWRLKDDDCDSCK